MPGRVYGESRVSSGNAVRLAAMEAPVLQPPGSSVSSPVRRVRIAAVADLHVRGTEIAPSFPDLSRLSEKADLLLVAGDLTDNGRLVEAEAVGELLGSARIPVAAVLGNHDLRTLRRAAFRRALERRGVELLEGGSAQWRLPNGVRVGIAGTIGCGGGFWPVEGPDAIHTRTLKRLAVRVRSEALALDRALATLDADVEIALTHFAPTISTLGNEPPGKYWMLGNCEFGVVLDRHAPAIVVHGHAHHGTLRGRTPGGVPVRNVALPIVGGIHFEVLEASPALGKARGGVGQPRHWLCSPCRT